MGTHVLENHPPQDTVQAPERGGVCLVAANFLVWEAFVLAAVPMGQAVMFL